MDVEFYEENIPRKRPATHRLIGRHKDWSWLRVSQSEQFGPCGEDERAAAKAAEFTHSLMKLVHD